MSDEMYFSSHCKFSWISWDLYEVLFKFNLEHKCAKFNFLNGVISDFFWISFIHVITYIYIDIVYVCVYTLIQNVCAWLYNPAEMENTYHSGMFTSQ